MDTSDQPSRHPPLSPPDGAECVTNPPSMIWRFDERAETYTLELSRDRGFAGDVIRVAGIDMPFYNHSAVLPEGTWFWRYFAVTSTREVSDPGPTRSFVVTSRSVPMAVPSTEQILADMPDHPRVYVTPDTLAAFRARREGSAKAAWEDLLYRVGPMLEAKQPGLDLRPLPENPGKKRKQVFYLKDGVPFVPKGYRNRELNRDASRARHLSLAYLVSGERAYAEAAKRWLLFVAPFRMDYHLTDRGQHDTVVYNYEYGLKGVALAFDRLYDLLSGEERRVVLAHIDYHGDNAYTWCRERLKLHLNYENSHGQQCMHALLTTALATAGDSTRADEWCDWLIRQYANRIAWGGNDGGYTEGQTYGHKFQFILDGLLAMATATGVDVFRKPRLRNSGEFWLYCMSLNYWWNHWGDVYSLLMPMVGNGADAYIAGLLASRSGNRALKWYADTVVASPAHVPFWYVSAIDLTPKPPVDIPQARLFPDVGQVAAYDRFYDHHGNRIFVRSSPWGSHSHAHADQNGFVLHAGGEIMACDAGYYTYYGDTYHRQWSMATQAHNSVLVNGKGQPKSIASKGRVSAFFNSPDYCLFTGDAATAYPGALEVFDRTVLFIRPGVFVVSDDLAAPEPSEFSWILNTFEAAEIDEAANTMVVRQRDQRLRIRHLAPDELVYSQSNERPYPMQTKSFCRYTEAFPQPYHIRVTTGGKRKRERFLAVMDAYEAGLGPTVSQLERRPGLGLLGLQLAGAGETETVVFRARGGEPGPRRMSGDGFETDARVASVCRAGDGDVVRWLLHEGTSLSVDGVGRVTASRPCDASARLRPAGGAVQVWLTCGAGTEVTVWLPERPRVVLCAAPNRPGEAVPLAFRWGTGGLRIAFATAGERVLWIDPDLNLRARLGPFELSVRDSDGTLPVELETAFADNGDIVAFGEVNPRETGLYRVVTAGGKAEILIQDRWDPVVSRRGAGEVSALLREGTEVFVRFPPSGPRPTVRAELAQSLRGGVVSLLRNGGFEEGIADYPPRGWTVSHPRTGDLGWPGWSQEAACEGESCLKFVRPKDRITLNSQPMRLRTGGAYRLRFRAKGTATHASVAVKGQRGTSAKVEIKPTEEWAEYGTELDAYPGACTVSVSFGGGGAPDQVVWVDDMLFGPLAP